MPETQAKYKDNSTIDDAITTLIRIKGMFGAVVYLTNPQGKNTDYPSEDFERWFSDIRDRLDEVVDLLCET